ncbi:sigma-70 family RNA polymerase sigma factor [Patulibacter sp. NPDC049589]|uniref:RNA polymerase sigma factor n=1 Tax=Patulibacter sp. NPDC049589 TaxID=3154731 RepID=UPI00342133A5
MTPTADHIASLYDRHAPEVLRYLARRTFEPETAVDLVAETFARAVADRRRFRGRTDEELVGWIYAIARNQLTDYLRRGRVEREAMVRLGMQRRSLPDADFDRIEQLIDLQGVRDEVAAALDELTEPQRHVLRLRVLEEQSYVELAARLGTSEQTARARVSRALRALRATPTFIRLGEERCA